MTPSLLEGFRTKTKNSFQGPVLVNVSFFKMQNVCNLHCGFGLQWEVGPSICPRGLSVGFCKSDYLETDRARKHPLLARFIPHQLDTGLEIQIAKVICLKFQNAFVSYCKICNCLKFN